MHKRGYTSKSGIGLVIERKTGLIIDFEILSSYCPICATTRKRLERQNILKYEGWFSVHQGVCSANYHGPSWGMEKEAALRIWSRSVVKNQLRYISMISDGDSKTISDLHILNSLPWCKSAEARMCQPRRQAAVNSSPQSGSGEIKGKAQDYSWRERTWKTPA